MPKKNHQRTQLTYNNICVEVNVHGIFFLFWACFASEAQLARSEINLLFGNVDLLDCDEYQVITLCPFDGWFQPIRAFPVPNAPVSGDVVCVCVCVCQGQSRVGLEGRNYRSAVSVAVLEGIHWNSLNI